MMNGTAFMCTNGGCGLLQFTFFVVVPLIGIFVVAVIAYSLSWLIRKHSPRDRPNLRHEVGSFAKILGTLIIIAIIAVLTFLIIPTMIQDDYYRKAQESCAKQVGYASPADDNNFDTSTAESQVAYRQCLRQVE